MSKNNLIFIKCIMSSPSIMKTVTPIKSSPFADTNSISENTFNPPTTLSFKHILIYTFIILSILLLIYNSYLYFTEKTDILAKHFGINISQYFQNTKVGVNRFVQGTKDTIDISKKNIDLSKGNKVHNINQKSPIENKNSSKTQKKEDLEKIDTESSYNSSLKKSKKSGGFCYIGTDKRHRHCVEMTPGDVCASNKIYPTRDICINPNLRT